MLIPHKGHTDTIQVYSVTVMTHVKALQAGHSSQGTSEPITPGLKKFSAVAEDCSLADDAEEALARLEEVLCRLSDFGLQLKAKKCTFMQTEVAFLGHIVGRTGLACDPENILAVRNWHAPGSVKVVRQFVSLLAIIAGSFRTLWVCRSHWWP